MNIPIMGIAFAICRAAKIKRLSGLKAHAGHAARTSETPNADPALSPGNPVLIGSGDPSADAQARMSILETPPRKNGVLAIDVLLTASPEYFRPDFPEMSGAYEMTRLDNFNAKALSWAQGYFGKENVVSVICHLDESTPHLSITVVPVDETPRKKGCRVRLNAARWLDGKKKLQEMQDSFANAVADLELKRGERGSRAQHQSVQRYYGQVERYPETCAENAALKQEVSLAKDQAQKAYSRGQEDQLLRNERHIKILRHQIRRLLKIIRMLRRLVPQSIGAVGIFRQADAKPHHENNILS